MTKEELLQELAGNTWVMIKPSPIEGIGVLEKTQQGQYQFTQGLFSNQKAEANPVALKEKRDASKPFFMMMHHKAPHRNWVPELKWLEFFSKKIIP